MLEFIQVKKYGWERKEFIQDLSKKVGDSNWYWVFKVNNKLYSHNLGLQMYEDAYYQMFKNDISDVKELIEKYHNIYMYESADTKVSLDYHKRTIKDYYQDIAVRRCLIRFGIWFKGESDLFKIHGTKLNDKHVPFHLPHLIDRPDSSKSARSWLDSNRLIVVAKEAEDKFQLSKVLVK